jgi:hypothetical protein
MENNNSLYELMYQKLTGYLNHIFRHNSFWSVAIISQITFYTFNFNLSPYDHSLQDFCVKIKAPVVLKSY